MKTALDQVLNHKTLSYSESKSLMDAMGAGEVSAEIMSAIVSVMKYRGETAVEIAGFASSLISQARKNDLSSELQSRDDLIDLVGTGGDGGKTFNITTTCSLLLASLGYPVLKHGNRAVSSKSGSSDVLTALGYDLNKSPEALNRDLNSMNFGFCFAPLYHQAFKNIAPVRKALKTRTVFNLLGPLVHPYNINYQMVGIYDGNLLELYADTLVSLGRKRAVVLASEDGMDEVSIFAATNLIFINGTEKKKVRITKEDLLSFGFNFNNPQEIAGGNAEENAKITRDILNNNLPNTSLESIVILNSAVALFAFGEAQSILEGIQLVTEGIRGGRSKNILQGFEIAKPLQAKSDENLIPRIQKVL